ncbi:spermatogenesis [Branchiostoma belcheri]|nr:spermatogenesis [Branchiostoma belcheri]
MLTDGEEESPAAPGKVDLVAAFEVLVYGEEESPVNPGEVDYVTAFDMSVDGEEESPAAPGEVDYVAAFDASDESRPASPRRSSTSPARQEVVSVDSGQSSQHTVTNSASAVTDRGSRDSLLQELEEENEMLNEEVNKLRSAQQEATDMLHRLQDEMDKQQNSDTEEKLEDEVKKRMELEDEVKLLKAQLATYQPDDDDDKDSDSWGDSDDDDLFDLPGTEKTGTSQGKQKPAPGGEDPQLVALLRSQVVSLRLENDRLKEQLEHVEDGRSPVVDHGAGENGFPESVPLSEYERLKANSVPRDDFDRLKSESVPLSEFNDLKASTVSMTTYKQLQEDSIPREEYERLKTDTVPREEFDRLREETVSIAEYEKLRAETVSKSEFERVKAELVSLSQSKKSDDDDAETVPLEMYESLRAETVPRADYERLQSETVPREEMDKLRGRTSLSCGQNTFQKVLNRSSHTSVALVFDEHLHPLPVEIEDISEAEYAFPGIKLAFNGDHREVLEDWKNGSVVQLESHVKRVLLGMFSVQSSVRPVRDAIGCRLALAFRPGSYRVPGGVKGRSWQVPGWYACGWYVTNIVRLQTALGSASGPSINMLIGTHAPLRSVTIDENKLKVAENFTYLGSCTNNKGQMDNELDCRLGKASAAFNQLGFETYYVEISQEKRKETGITGCF